MALTVNAKTYTGNSYAANAVTYIGPASTLSVKDSIVLRRTDPKPTPVFSGVGRVNLKLTRTHALVGALTPSGEAILNIDLSIPVGSSQAAINALIDDIGAWLATADGALWAENLKINF